MRRRITLLAVIAALAASLVAVTAPPAAATQYSYACNPSATGWTVKARWGDGTVMEARACLQFWYNNPYNENFHRVRVEWRMRRGGDALSGTDWDLDPNYTTYIAGRDGRVIGPKYDHADIFNASYIATYSIWECGGPHQDYQGRGVNIRATPPGLPKSSYHSHYSLWTNAPTIRCANA
jgi:hypothetical protein